MLVNVYPMIMLLCCLDCEKHDPNSMVSSCVHCYDYCNGTRWCSWDCLGDCDCKPGFMFGDDNKCVSADNCTVSIETKHDNDIEDGESTLSPSPEPTDNQEVVYPITKVPIISPTNCNTTKHHHP